MHEMCSVMSNEYYHSFHDSVERECKHRLPLLYLNSILSFIIPSLFNKK